jgi:hypothetical protein
LTLAVAGNGSDGAWAQAITAPRRSVPMHLDFIE